jgi:hypothetical protein
MTVHVDDVVQVARAASLDKCTEFLAEELHDGVAAYSRYWKGVAVRVPDRTQYWPVHKDLVRSEVEFNFRHRRAAVRAAVSYPALCREMAPLILLPLERLVFENQTDTGLLLNPLGDLVEDLP